MPGFAGNDREVRPAVVAIVGPTGSGKSALGLFLAERLGGEIVSCDALQVYRGLDVGTAKVPPSERRGVPHHLLDLVPADEEFSAARYVEHAVPVIEDIAARGRLPILVGGTGLYLRALRTGLFEGPGRSQRVRERLQGIAERRGTKALHRILRRWDPALAQRVHPNDRVRLVRGIEVYLASGRPMSELMESRRRPLLGFRDILIGLRPDRETLAARIEARVEAMFSRGLPEEVLRLRNRHGTDVPAFKAIGYREAALLVDGKIDADRARELVARATLRYAKRQATWFRREPGIRWFEGVGDDEALASSVLEAVRRAVSRSDNRHNSERVNAETAP